jgi:phage terminase large subunit GpA-like protein
VKLRTRNEALDATVYAIWASHVLDLHRYTDRMWDRLEAAVQPATGDLFDAAPSVPQPVSMKDVPRGAKRFDAAPVLTDGARESEWIPGSDNWLS